MAKTQSLKHLIFEKDSDNSMLKSDFIDQKDLLENHIIIEKDEEDGGEVVKENIDYKLVKSSSMMEF